MSEEPRQETPGGASIPVPAKADVFRDLRKVAKIEDGDSDASAGGADEEQGE